MKYKKSNCNITIWLLIWGLDILGYSRQENVYCMPYKDRAWINLREAKHACLQDPDCDKFFYRCGNTDFKLCSKNDDIVQSTCGSIIYTKGKFIDNIIITDRLSIFG